MTIDLGFSMGFHGYNYGKNVPNHQPAWNIMGGITMHYHVLPTNNGEIDGFSMGQ